MKQTSMLLAVLALMMAWLIGGCATGASPQCVALAEEIAAAAEDAAAAAEAEDEEAAKAAACEMADLVDEFVATGCGDIDAELAAQLDELQTEFNCDAQ